MPPSDTSTDPQPLPGGTIEALALVVQRNCDLADAVHAGDLTLCTYLLEMRELYRWQRQLPLSSTPARAEVGAWIAAREQYWQTLADEPDARYAPLPLAPAVDAFDDERANALLAGRRLYYGAGIERFGRPGFFLADLASEEQRDGARAVVTEREYARGLNPPPAASRGDLVLVRRDVLRRWLWTKTETASRRAAGDAFAAAVSEYDAGGDIAATLERMAHGEAETLMLHELGERRASRMLGADWEAMLSQLADRRAELVVRAVRDVLADCIVTLPTLIERDALASIHFWFSTFDGFRRDLAPSLRAAYAGVRDGARAPLARAVSDGVARFEDEAMQIVHIWRTRGADGVVEHAARIAPPR